MPYKSKEERAAYAKAYRAKNRERLLEYDRLRNAARRQDPEYVAKHKILKEVWKEANKEKKLATDRAYENRRRKTDIQWRLRKNLRHRLRKAMLGKTTGVSAVRDLGISIEEFKEYLEKKFTEGMSWENYGAWHIDHIEPLVSFDLSNEEQVRKACHYTNLQPLWAEDNIRKGGKPKPDTWPKHYQEATKALGLS